MLAKNFIGVDVSKLTIDVFVRESRVHKMFRSEHKGFEEFVKWLKSQVVGPLNSIGVF